MLKKKFRVIGNSMSPVIKPGDFIQFDQIDTIENLKVFDIVIFNQNGELICHYFWRKNQYFTEDKDEIVITRPLNPLTAYDHPIKGSDILGKVKYYKIGLYHKILIFFHNFLNKMKYE